MIVSIHNGNIDPRIIAAQKRVFEAFGHEIDQRLYRKSHGESLDDVMAGAQGAVLIADIDCIPLHHFAIDNALIAAGLGILYGAAGIASHLPRKPVYVHPCWLAISTEHWLEAGSPSFCGVSGKHDVGGLVTDAWQRYDWPIMKLMPTAVERPLWPFPDGVHCSGIGTTFGGDCYHLFEGRNNKNTEMFLRKCDYILSTLGSQHE